MERERDAADSRRPFTAAQVESIDYSHGHATNMESIDYNHGQSEDGPAPYHTPPPAPLNLPPVDIPAGGSYGASSFYGGYYEGGGYPPTQQQQYPGVPPYGVGSALFPPGLDPASLFAAYTGQTGELMTQSYGHEFG